MKQGLSAAAMALLLTVFAGAQTQTPAPITVGSADTAAAAGATKSGKHVFAANTPAGLAYKDKVALVGPPTIPFPPGGNRYPGDMSYQGGPVVGQVQSHAIYLLNSPTVGDPGCTPATIATCWGNPEKFLKNLGKSDFIHVVDQYTQRYDSNRYTVGGDAAVYFVGAVPHELTDATMLAIVHLVATAFNYPTGYTNQFHVFLPPGTDECFDSTFRTCYSPDIPSSFAFCAYHSSADFADIGHTLYSVEPYQNVGGCSVPPNGPQGQLADSTNNVLSHELIETITDPDGDAWWVTANNALFGAEIADECSFLVFTPGGVFFNPSVVKLNGVKYALQPEYSNIGHACRTDMEE